MKKMKELLKDEFEDYIKSFDEKNYQAIRANTLKISPHKLKESLNFELEPIDWCEEGFYYNSDIRPAKHPYYYAGLFYIQEPSAMSTAAALEINEGDRIADLCAAPGGKSTHAAAKLKGSGVILSNDISASRCRALVKNIELCSAGNAVITNESPERLAERFEGFFTKVIADAPCSGEGMFRKDPDAVKSWQDHKSEQCQILQREILNSAARLVCPGGIIAYSTCTFAPAENEQTINDFLDTHPEFKILDINKAKGVCDGRPDWIENGRSELKKCARLWPHKIKGEGHFLALLQKDGELEPRDMPKISAAYKNKIPQDLYSFFRDYINFEISDDIEIHSNSVFKIPQALDLSRLRTARSGLYLGELKKNRFEPSQAFAMTLKKENVKNSVDFKLDDERVLRYLKGESFEANVDDGWCLVLVDGYALGWGKAKNGRLKNKYPSGWRMQ